ncbi:GntR family transcriptional regulator [Nonomuraea roseoviolacea]|uniref:DNA-binding GntR family transcriptional regulator n=1 Tax=Nonomuraea roseoviolacea subsp. carminata TaxID=160689 RepID=A0ABT1K997_9ACTN|nr:GntR family transcriptional regulator [Nonomuraea roseoviolacea]MCP2350578.1 DNA-binding GntR family transcriptional regulator [Nonomuraea roseoviolacea subsp. carminata]
MTDATGRTLYLQIVNDLRSQIASGALRVGDPIPSTTELKERYGYSVTVVRKAVEVLRNEGLVIGQPGKAVYVQATPEAIEAERTSVEDLAEQVADLRTQVAELRGTVEQLYTRLGHQYPNDDAGQPARHRKTGT